jgi:hypothetical protein
LRFEVKDKKEVEIMERDFNKLREIFATLFAKGFTEEKMIKEIRRISAKIALEEMKKTNQ